MKKQYLTTIILGIIIVLYVSFSIVSDSVKNGRANHESNTEIEEKEDNKEKGKKEHKKESNNSNEEEKPKEEETEDVKEQEENKEDTPGEENVPEQTPTEEPTPTPEPPPTPEPTPTPKEPVIPSGNLIEAYFLNSINNSSFKVQDSYGNNDAFIFKTYNNKYILLDTGVTYTKENLPSTEIINLIYNKLKSLYILWQK